MAGLESQQREVLTLVVQDGATVAEAARRLKQPIPAVVISLRDALSALQTALNPSGADTPVETES
jgi:DNA-directed RNA polymerase specialized sigma24 family protein